MAPGNVFLSVL